MTPLKTCLQQLASWREQRIKLRRQKPQIIVPKQLYIFVTGHANLFWQAEQVNSPRIFIKALTAGDLLLLPETEKPGQFLVLGERGSNLLSLDTEQHFADLQQADLNRQLFWQQAWENGLTSLAKATQTLQTAPTHPLNLSAQQTPTLHVDTMQYLTPQQHGVWVKLTNGEAFNQTTKSVTTQQWLWLSRYQYFQTQGVVDLECNDTLTLMQTGQLQRALQASFALLVNELPMRVEKQQLAFQHNVKSRLSFEHNALNDGLMALAKKTKSYTQELEVTEDTVLFSTVKFLLEHMGKNGHQIADNLRPAEDLVALLLPVSVETRQVALDKDWWQKDSGPLLGFLQKNNQPVALIPQANHYQCINLVNQQTTLLDHHSASQLKPQAVMLYLPLDDDLKSTSNLLKNILQPHHKALWFFAFLILGGALLSSVQPVASGILINQIIPSGEVNQLLLMLAAVVGMGFGAALFQWIRGLLTIKLTFLVEHRLMTGLWNRITRLPPQFFKQYNAGDLADRTSALSSLKDDLSASVINHALGSFTIIFNLMVMFYYSVWLALISFIFLLVITMVMFIFTQFQRTAIQQSLHLGGKLEGQQYQIIQGLPKLRTAHAEAFAYQRWAKLYDQSARQQEYLSALGNGMQLVITIASLLGIGMLFVAVHLIYGFKMPVGDFFAFNVAFGAMLSACFALLGQLPSFYLIPAKYQRVRPLLLAQPESSSQKHNPGRLTGRIEVKSVCFYYGQAADTPVLKDVSIHVNPGEFIAIVGTSGSGKSTLMRLLLGFETPQSGAVYFDGQDMNELDLRQLRRQFGVVLQNSQILAGSLLENVVGANNLGEKEAWLALRAAGLEKDVRDMPMGLHTSLSMDATTLSGGQRQRLMIARALVYHPQILLFDEATSALDNQTQAQVSASLDALKVTRIVVAHRLSTIKQADRIYVMDKGHLVEQGSYAELMQKNGLFANLAKRQIM